MKKIINKFQPILYFLYQRYYSKPRLISKRGIKIKLYPSVFHPTFNLSTDIFLDYLLTQNINNSNLLELGTGNGFISLFLSKNYYCKVTATDINQHAIEGLKNSQTLNNLNLNIIYSDLFDNIPVQHFDYIVINPPFYPKKANGLNEVAYFCGEHFEYFHKCFQQLAARLDHSTNCLMILSDTAPIDTILSIGQQYQIKAQKVFSKNKMWEEHIIFKLSNK